MDGSVWRLICKCWTDESVVGWVVLGVTGVTGVWLARHLCMYFFLAILSTSSSTQTKECQILCDTVWQPASILTLYSCQKCHPRVWHRDAKCLHDAVVRSDKSLSLPTGPMRAAEETPNHIAPLWGE